MEATLTIDLFEPGMSPLHRAGLGGLASTLKRIQDSRGKLPRPPGSWEFDDRHVVLHWKGPNGAAEFFQSLYSVAFRETDGLIDLPGSYGQTSPGPEVKAALQQGMSSTILQFGPNRKARTKTPIVKTYDMEGQSLTIEHQDLESYTHRGAWKDLVTNKGALREQVTISGTIAPGFVQRHVAYAESSIEQTPGLAVSLHFALVGTLALSIGRKGGVLLIPDVKDLISFVRTRPTLTPGSASECHVASPADAALQAQVRVRQSATTAALDVDRCFAILFASKSWNEKQKTRTQVIEVMANSDELDLFEAAMSIQELKPRVALARPEKKGDAPRPFVVTGIVRPLIAENLARHDPWYKGFRILVVSHSSSQEDMARNLSYESKGLSALIEKMKWTDTGEKVLIESIHQAMRSRFADIGDDTDDPITFSNRLDRQRQEWRLEFGGAKTHADVRKALADLWSRPRYANPKLREAWQDILPIICDESRWELVRDLALLALASYRKPEKPAEAKIETSR